MKLADTMIDRTAVKATIINVAKKHRGRYLLPKRFRTNPLAPKSALDHVYDACEELVNEGKARWLREGSSWESGPGPGIELTRRADA